MSSRHESQEEIAATLDALTVEVAKLQEKSKAQEMLINSLILVLHRSNNEISSVVLEFFNEFNELGLIDLLNQASELEVEYFRNEVTRVQNTLGLI